MLHPKCNLKMSKFFISIYENRLKTYETVNMKKHEYLILQMFMPLIWCPQIVRQIVLEEEYNLSYRKLHYPNYVKNINLNVHMIRISKKDIFKLMVKLWNLISSSCLASLALHYSNIMCLNCNLMYLSCFLNLLYYFPKF
jgi:hypothetical protein